MEGTGNKVQVFYLQSAHPRRRDAGMPEANASLDDLVASTSCNSHHWQSVLAIHGRSQFISRLKPVLPLNRRQALANALLADGRRGKLPSPSFDVLRGMLSTTSIFYDVPHCRRIFALTNLHANYPFLRGEVLSAELQKHCIGAQDVCVCCGAASSNLTALREALQLLRATFAEIIFVAGDEDVRVSDNANPSPAAPRDERQQLHAVFTLCDELEVRYSTVQIGTSAIIDPRHALLTDSGGAWLADTSSPIALVEACGRRSYDDRLPRLRLLIEFSADGNEEEEPMVDVSDGPVRSLTILPNRLTRPNANGPSLVFASYGDDRYSYQRERITQQACDSGWFTHVHEPFTRADAERLVSSEGCAEAVEVLNRPRGGGYWIWKPLVVREMLRSLRDGDVMLYADAGCSIVSQAKDEWWSKVRRLSESRPIDAHQLDAENARKIGCPVTNAVWSRMDAIMHVLGSGVVPEQLSAFLSREQIEAGRLLILNTPQARALVNEWCELALKHPKLFTDDKSALPNAPGFKEHRHDQSIFGALMWRYGWSGSSEWESVPATQLRTETLEFWSRAGLRD